MPGSKYWCFTLNNYDPTEEQTIASLHDAQGTPVTFLIYGREIGENGTRHLQGYIEFSTRKRLTGVKRLLGERVHLEARRGTAQEAADYCRKDGDFVTYGEISVPQQGRRNDLESLHSDLTAGKPLREIAEDHFGSFIRYQRGISAFRNVVSPSRDWVCNVVVYWGRTGTGKTRSVIDNLPSPEDIYIHSGGKWFDGYDGHKIVLFDDFEGNEFAITYLLKLLDRYPMRVPIKGGFVSWIPLEIYLTSNSAPEHWYPNANPQHVAAMFRRFSNVVKFE